MILTITLNAAIDKVYWVDSFGIGEVFRTDRMRQTAGGKGLNVSRVASILGAEITASGFLGGRNGEFIREQITKQGIKDAFIVTEGDTRTCIAISDPIKGTSTEILEVGSEISLQEQEMFLDHYRSLVKEASIVAISGSLPRGIPNDFYGRLIDISGELDKKVILDTSGQALADSLKHGPYMIKPNLYELEALVGKSLTEEEILEVAIDLHKNGIELVCVTLGAKGCIAVSKGGGFGLRPPQVDIINTVGSGDAFVAGCAVSLTQGKSFIDVLKTALACGTANTQFENTGMVSRELVDKFFRESQIQRLY